MELVANLVLRRPFSGVIKSTLSIPCEGRLAEDVLKDEPELVEFLFQKHHFSESTPVQN